MWSCPNCKKRIDTDAIYCSHCGASRFNAEYKDHLLHTGIIHYSQSRSSRYNNDKQIRTSPQNTQHSAKTCKQCGCRLPDNAAFCRECGENVTGRSNYS